MISITRYTGVAIIALAALLLTNLFLLQSVHASSGANVVVLSSSNPAVVGKAVTLAIAVAPSASSFTYPSGTVTVSVDGVGQSPVSLTKGYASLTLSSLTAGSHAVVATYSGDGTYAASASPIMTQVVTASFDKPLPYGIDVTQHGLKGDGVTDNTAALRALIASFPSNIGYQGAPPGGQRLYFPAGTYLVSDTINFLGLSSLSIVGDVDQNGNPISIIKANSIATAHPVKPDVTDTPNLVINYYPVLNDDGNNYDPTSGSAATPIHIKNIRIDAPTTKNAVALALGGSNENSFENMVFTGYIGILGPANVFTSAIRDSKFIGPGTPGSIGIVGFLQLVENTQFSNWDTAAIGGNCGLSLVRDTFTHNHIGFQGGYPGWLAIEWDGCGSMQDNVFTDNDIAIEGYVSSNHWSNTTIVGSTNAPSGQSQNALWSPQSLNGTYTGLNISGSFSNAIFGIDNAGGFQDNFYGSHWSNSYPGAPTFATDSWNSDIQSGCPANSSCAYNRQYWFHPYTYACQAGTMQVSNVKYHYDATSANSVDCSAYVAPLCNGKNSCTVSYAPQNCPGGGPAPSSGTPTTDTTIICSGSTANAPVTGITPITIVDAPEPGFIADADNVTASHFVAAPQPTLNSHAMFIDVSQHGVASNPTLDQTAAIQALINTAPDGAVFYFPHGSYRVSTLDFSHLKSFTLLGDGPDTGSSISGTGSPLIKIDYGAGIGSFQIRDITIDGAGSTIYAHNAVLSNMENVSVDEGRNSADTGVVLDNSFMVSMRSVHLGGGSNGIMVNGGMRSTVEMQDNNGGSQYGYREWGIDHAVNSSRYEVQIQAGVQVGVDANGTPQPSVGFSLAGLEEEANGVGIKVTKCQNCSFSGGEIYGHSLQYVGPNGGEAPDYYGLYVDDVHNTLFSTFADGGYFWNADLTVTSKASNILFTAMNAWNAWAGCTATLPTCNTGSATWLISPQASGIVVSATNISTSTSLYPNVIYSTNGGISGGSTPPPPPPTPTPPPPPPPPTPAAAPTVSLSVSPTSVTAGQSATLTWGSTNATSCTGVNFTASGVTGAVVVTPTGTTNYSVTCTGTGGSATASATVTLTTITPTPTPTPTPSTFSIGTRVKTIANLNVRSKASNGKGIKILCTQPAGSLGTIKSGPTSAGGYLWWNVDYDTKCDGWSVQNYLTGSISEAQAPNQLAGAAQSVDLQQLRVHLEALLVQLQAYMTNGGATGQ